MTCWQCGAPLPPDAGFCRGCGAFARPRNVVGNSPGTSQPGLSQSPVALPPAAVSARTPSPWLATSAPASPALRPGAVPSELAPASMLGDVLVAAGAGFVVISLFLTWYSVTLTTVGVQFYDRSNGPVFPLSADCQQFRRAYGTHDVLGVGTRIGSRRLAVGDPCRVDRPLAGSVAGDQFEHEKSVPFGLASHADPPRPGSYESHPCRRGLSEPALWRHVVQRCAMRAPGIGAYLGFLAALVACGGAIAGLVKSRPRATSG